MQLELESAGIFFHKDFVAVTHPHEDRPHCAGRLMEVAEPEFRPLTLESSEEPPSSIVRPSSPDPESTEGGEDQPEPLGGAFSGPCIQDEDVVQPDVSDPSDDREEEDAASDGGLGVLSLSAVREVGEGSVICSTSLGEAEATGEGDTDTEPEVHRYVQHSASTLVSP